MRLNMLVVYQLRLQLKYYEITIFTATKQQSSTKKKKLKKLKIYFGAYFAMTLNLKY